MYRRQAPLYHVEEDGRLPHAGHNKHLFNTTQYEESVNAPLRNRKR